MMNFKNKKVMLNIQNLVEDLILELATRVGPPDLGKEDHVRELFSVMEDFGISQQVQIQIRKNLLNEADEKEFKLPILNKEIPYKDNDGNAKRNKVGNLITLPDEHPGRKAAERELDRLSPEEEQKAKDEIGGQGKSTADKQKEKQQTKTDTTDTEDAGPQTVTGRPVGADLSDPDGEYQKREQDANSQSQKENEIKAGIPKQKNKTLSDIDTKSTDIYTNEDTGVSDEDFDNNVPSIYENSADKLKPEDLDEYFKSGKIPMKYKTTISRLINTQKGSQQITDYMSGVGAGQLQSQAGEILTMAAIGMDNKEFEGFMKLLEEKISKYPKGSKPIITKDWLESVRHVRSVTMKRYNSQFGKGNWEIEATAWDVEGEFVALGNDNYKENKGFSSDMYVKVKVNGSPVLDEISLKKDSTANIYNGVVTDIKNWSPNVPESADIDVYKKGEMERPVQYGKDAQTLQIDRKILTSETVMKNKELRHTLQALGVVSGDAKKGYKIEPKAEEIIAKLESMPIPPPIDLARFKQTFNTAKKDRFKKFLIMHAACQRAKEISEGNDGETTSFKFLNNHLGYKKGEDGKFPKGSIKRYENDTIQFLVEDEAAKEGCLNALAEKLPMKALIEGEEKMAIGGLSADPKTLQRVFGIDNYKDFKAGLTMKEDDFGTNYLVYRSEKPSKEISIAIVKVRQKGKGYAPSVGLEFEIAKDFGKALYAANKEEYPPEPEISDSERRKLDI